MRIKFSNRGSTLIIHMPGELDHHSSEFARQKIDGELIKSTTRDIIFDLSQLAFMDSSGIGVIMGRYRNIQKLGGKAAVVTANPQVRRILELSGIFKIIPVFASIDDAVKQYSSK